MFFLKNYIITGQLECVTGLHIGESLDTIDIGGSDNPLVRKSTNNLPYIPGSSLKGKLRTLLELADKESSKSVIANNGRASDKGLAAQLFGVSGNEEKLDKNGVYYKVIVRDLFPSDETIKAWNENTTLLNGSELKYENTLNRLTAEAKPRNIERVPPESCFKFEIIVNTASKDDKKPDEDESDNKECTNKDVLPILQAMKLLEDDYLGGSGSRGFGKVCFKDINIVERSVDYYIENNEETLIASGTLLEVIDNIKQ